MYDGITVLINRITDCIATFNSVITGDYDDIAEQHQSAKISQTRSQDDNEKTDILSTVTKGIKSEYEL